VKKQLLLLLAVAAGLLLWLAWMPTHFTFLIFIAFVPLLIVANKTTKRLYFFWYTYATMFTWNSLTTWWLWNATPEGAIGAIVANSLIMCLPWWGYYILKTKFSKLTGYTALVAFIMLFEYIHLNWQLSWPWLNLGNVFANQTNYIQWYEYTGISGGTAWILIVNILVFNVLGKWKVESRKWKIKNTVTIFLALAIPILISIIINPTLQQSLITLVPKETKNVVIVQPNIDPYQKFESISTSQQIEKLLALSNQKVDSSTQLLVWPETALSANISVNDIATSNVYKNVFAFVNSHPNLTLLTGIETNKVLGSEKTTPSARKTNQGIYYDAYNAAIAIHANENIQLYIKSKLVPGVETLPSFLNILSPIFEKFGGTTAGYAKDTASAVFINTGNAYIAAPIICYESIYGEYVASYVQKGANILTIITNDGWWGNTPGHKQHLAMASLRAIETRRWVARSANTGISAIINPQGEIVQQTKWDEATAIKYNIPSSNYKTFYVQYGDYLYKVASAIGVLLIVWNLFLWMKKKIMNAK
jgi:apolipoprotein N-acyltransferase